MSKPGRDEAIERSADNMDKRRDDDVISRRRRGLKTAAALSSNALRVEEAEEAAAALDAITASEDNNPFDPGRVASAAASAPGATPESVEAAVAAASRLSPTTRPEAARLLSSLGININLGLSKGDTANLLACLLTCNEGQLEALLGNRRLPLAIKTLVRRLLIDAAKGDTSTVEMVWDRVFGKGPMQQGPSGGADAGGGILPSTPVSREAYIIIRDTLLK
jgi:hypothetical protein